MSLIIKKINGTVSKFAIVMARADAGDDGDLGGAVLHEGDALGLLHEKRSEALMLELDNRYKRK